MILTDFEDYESYQVNEQEADGIISVYADVCEYFDFPDEACDMLKCDAGF